jgi:predicted DNA-binding transcriptional regulator AlpA
VSAVPTIDLPAIDDLPIEQVPVLLTALSAYTTQLATRLLVNGNGHGATPEDRLINIDEAAKRLAVSRSYLYRRLNSLPFVVRHGRGAKFSSLGIDRYIQRRQGRN